jgi:hypothetical protein
MEELTMSLAHVRLVKVAESSDVVEYKVQSPDFDSSGKWADIGRLRLFASAAEYEFDPFLPTSVQKLLPPSIYKLSEAERQRLLDGEFKDFGWGAWAMTIHHYAETLLRNGKFPERHP